MTTIGTAVLQIIPSLKGVTDAIEKQIDGKVVEVKVAPKVDTAAAKKAGKDAGEAVATEAKEAVKKGDVGKAVAEEIKTSVKKAAPGKDIAKVVTEDVKKSSPGRDIAKVIVDGLADGVKQGLPSGSVGGVIVDNIADQVKKGIDTKGLGKTITDALGNIKIGSIGNITNSLGPLKDVLKEFNTGDLATGLGGTIDVLRNLESVGVPTEVADGLEDVLSGVEGFNTAQEGFTNTVGTITSFAESSPALKGKLDPMIATLSSIGPAIAAASILEKPAADANAWAEQNIPWYAWLNQYTPDKLGAMARDRFNAFWEGIHHDGGNNDRLTNPTTGLPAAQSNAPAGSRDRGGVPILIDPITKLPVGQSNIPGRAGGGQVFGAGTGTSDSILAWLSNKEFVVNADATRKNLPLLEIINSGKLPGFSGGGEVDVDALKKYASGITGGKYVRGGPPGLSGTDCSGAQSAIANFITGGSGRFATAGEAYALASRGFQAGDPPPGVPAYWVGWVNGGPGGGHTSGTIVDPTGGNVNVEMGGASGGGAYGGPAGGAARFANRAWIPIAGKPTGKTLVGGEDPKTPDSFSGGDAASSGGSGGFALASSLSGLASTGLGGLGVTTKASPSSPERTLDLGSVASAAIGGQVSSALGVLGVGNNPPFLQAASKLLSGISIGGGSAPLPDGDMHGSRAGQTPGPTYNIYARDAEDALVRTQRFQDQRTAAKLSVY